MSIRVVIIDKDELYLSRLSQALEEKCGDEIILTAIDSAEKAEGALNGSPVDVLLIGENAADEVSSAGLSFKAAAQAYLAETREKNEIGQIPAFCKYQQPQIIIDTIKQILKTAEESNPTARIYTFTSSAGGTGTSTAAAAFAMYLAGEGRKVIYINLEKIASTGEYFSAESTNSIEDAFKAVADGGENTDENLRKCINKDECGVDFFSPSDSIAYSYSYDSETIVKLIDAVRSLRDYNEIIIDMPFSLGNDARYIFGSSENVLMVSDGSVYANRKVSEAIKQLALDSSVGEFFLIYNKFTDNNDMISGNGVKTKGGIQLFADVKTAKAAAVRIAAMAMWSHILKAN